MSRKSPKTAIVIGVGPDRGLGGQLCKRFASEGLHVLVAGRTREKLDAIVQGIQKDGGSAEPFVADATSESDTHELFDKADDALRQIRSECFDLVVADLLVPGVDGVGLLEQLQSTSADIPVIVLTEQAAAGEATTALKRGAFAVLRKPCAMDRLVATIDRAAWSGR